MGDEQDQSDGGDVPCPTCERYFESKGGMRRHHALSHGESLVQETSECETCGEAFESRPDGTGRFCSRECHREYQQRDLTEHLCPTCEETFTAPPADERIYCSHKCSNKAKRTQERRNCEQCGRVFRTQPSKDATYCCRECESEARLTRPRPRNIPMLLWLLYVYEGHNVKQTYRRHRAVLGFEDCLRQDELRETLGGMGVKQSQNGNPAKYEDALARMDPDEIGASTPDGDDSWKPYSGREGRAD
jgi:hypothetical protein